jgi:hypothetical protein
MIYHIITAILASFPGAQPALGASGYFGKDTHG